MKDDIMNTDNQETKQSDVTTGTQHTQVVTEHSEQIRGTTEKGVETPSSQLNKYGYHPYAQMLPRMSTDKKLSLQMDLQKNGLKQPIIIHEETLLIIDGINRYEALREIGKDLSSKDIKWVNGDDEDMRSIVRTHNLLRRDLNPYGRAKLAAENATLKPGQNQKTKPSQLDMTQQEACDFFGTNLTALKKASSILNDGIKEVQEAVEGGDLTLHMGSIISNMPTNKQVKALTSFTNKSDNKNKRNKASQQEKQTNKSKSDESVDVNLHNALTRLDSLDKDKALDIIVQGISTYLHDDCKSYWKLVDLLENNLGQPDYEPCQ